MKRLGNRSAVDWTGWRGKTKVVPERALMAALQGLARESRVRLRALIDFPLATSAEGAIWF
jgi:hypothetical protein